MKNQTKTHKDENFPVASLLLGASMRKPILDFYRFARSADDIADEPTLSSAEKHERLNQLDDQATNRFQVNLLRAFHQDVDKSRYETWDELIQYCQYSANPVGRFLLSLYGETSNDALDASDDLCTSLQILNHLQDCQKDFKAIDRIYLPQDQLQKNFSFDELLSQDKTNPELRRVLDYCLDETDKLLLGASKLPSQITSKRLRYQAKTTLLCAKVLAKKLRTQDPLAIRVELNTFDKIMIAIKGFFV